MILPCPSGLGWAPSVTMIRWSEDPLGAPGDDPGTGARCWGLLISGMTMRMMRTMMLGSAPAGTTSGPPGAKGFAGKRVVGRAPCPQKNALIPVITVVGTQIPWMVGRGR